MSICRVSQIEAAWETTMNIEPRQTIDRKWCVLSYAYQYDQFQCCHWHKSQSTSTALHLIPQEHVHAFQWLCDTEKAEEQSALAYAQTSLLLHDSTCDGHSDGILAETTGPTWELRHKCFAYQYRLRSKYVVQLHRESIKWNIRHYWQPFLYLSRESSWDFTCIFPRN